MITTGYLRFLISFDVNKHLSEVFGCFFDDNERLSEVFQWFLPV